jgi:enoyl-CoA hydratase
MDYETLIVDDSEDGIRTITLNRPEKRNAINNAMRTELLNALQSADRDAAIKVSVIKGAGKCFSSGYDLGSDLAADQPYFSAEVGLPWARHVSEGCLSLWDLAKPVIAQVHGYAMAGGLELLGACDLAYASTDARMSHPVLVMSGLADFNWFCAKLSHRDAMELFLTGREYNGEEAASIGLINQAFAPEELDERVTAIARQVAAAPSPVRTVQKRFVYSALDATGARATVMHSADLNNGPHMQALMSGSVDVLSSVKKGSD